jgi:GMP synthase-like glutamine amidotransferase
VTPRALVLQHQHNAPPALLADWGRERDVELVVVRADRRATLPEPGSFQFSVVLGSDHSAHGLTLPWVVRELAWLRLADQRSLPVLGICFGAQALAVALGGGVRRARYPEVGWVSVQTDDRHLIGDGPWFAWHEDVIQLPDLATEIARNDFGPQAFTAGANLGVQFHPEVTPDLTAIWAARPRGVRQLAMAGLNLERLVQEGRRNGPGARAAAFRLFDAFASRGSSPAPHLNTAGAAF